MSDEVHIPTQNYLWLLIGIWSVALFDAVLLAAGFFSTGRCREWCCRPPMTRRGLGKCSCRRCCRVSYPCLSTFVIFLLVVLVVGSIIFAMAAAGFLFAKKMGDLVCREFLEGNLQPGFELDLARLHFGDVVTYARMQPFCDGLLNTDSAMKRVCYGAAAMLLGQVAHVIASTANRLHVARERLVALPPPKMSGGSSSLASPSTGETPAALEMTFHNPVGSTGSGAGGGRPANSGSTRSMRGQPSVRVGEWA